MTFADGSTETLARFIDFEDVPRGVGGSYYPAAVDDEARSERCRRMAVSRAKRELRWALQSIGADRMLTCTFRGNVDDRARALAVWGRFVRMVKARYPDWKFVAVMERQERGAWHFHSGVRGFQPVNYLRTCWRLASGSDEGNIDVQPPRSRGSAGLSGYLGKYLAKAFEWMPKGSRRFNASHDRARPVIDRWWLEFSITDAEVVRVIYRATCGTRAAGVSQWASSDGDAYMVRCDGPPVHEPLPF